jgi:hypothetical protein
MRIGKNEWKICVADIETMKEYILLSFYDFEKDIWYEFEINSFKNDLYKFVNFYNKSNWDRIVWYNGIGFDTQVIQFILDSYQEWFDFTNLEVCQIIYSFVQKLIDDKKFGMFNPYKVERLEIPPIDVFTILGLDNEARYTSLKKCQFQLDYKNVEEMPIHHGKTNLTQDEINLVKSYCRNDVLSTYQVFKLTLGDTDHPLYKGNNQIDLRLDIQEEFGLDCINYSDIKIGDELLKLSYAKEINKDIKNLPNKGFFRKEIKLKFCIPKYVSFKTPQLSRILDDTKSKVIGQRGKHEVCFNFKGTEYTIGLGGGHSSNDSQIWEEDENHLIVDLDVGSLYPAIIVNNEYYPYHLGKQLLSVYKKLYEKRIELKPLAKKDRKIAGIVGAIKLILNSAYGKMGSMDSWMYDKQVQVSVCLTGQFALLMLIEAMELAGIHVFMFNTDGITLKLPKTKLEEFEAICKEWEKTTSFILERKDYSKMMFSTVNDYIAFTKDGEIKKKGDFITDFELWKNKSCRVVPLALEAYFKDGVSPDTFIKNHQNILDFCIMSRATGELHLELQDSKGNTNKLNKLVRYYYSTNSDWQLFKRGTGSTGKPMNVNQAAPNEIGTINIQYFNEFEDKAMKDYYIDYNQYIYKAYKLIDKVSKTKKANAFIKSLSNSVALTLF